MDKSKFRECIESLKKYRRAELERDGENIIEDVYTDLLPDNYILNKCLLENTTFLIGRKGTGKSTIFLRLEKELKKNDKILSCYLDVYTIYSESQRTLTELAHLKDKIPLEILRKYLLERNFTQKILLSLIEQLSTKTSSFLNKIKKTVGLDKNETVKELLEELSQNIEDNETLKKIELPLIQEFICKNKITNQTEKKGSISGSVNIKPQELGASIGGNYDSNNFSEEQLAEEFSKVFIKVFQINDLISKIKSILKLIGIKHLYILLDDFSEIENFAIKNFVNIILSPLNNNSDEFIKFKVAAYPGRYFLGNIDPGKIDIINLDFYNLYSNFDRDTMEKQSLDFTKRLLKNRFKNYGNLNETDFFDTKIDSMDKYYEKLFQVSMNVPRIVGYILSYCYESKIIYDKKITLSDIESASQRYYQDNIETFFSEIRISTTSMHEKITSLELKKLLKEIIARFDNLKSKIIKQELKGLLYDPKHPYTSHFYFNPKFEKYLQTLELNFFISKYNSLSNKDGDNVSIYCINYGLAKKFKLFWGKPSDIPNARKYFIERPFNFNQLIGDFFKKTKSIHCTNPECSKLFTEKEKSALELYSFKCPNCGFKVIEESVSPEILTDLKSIDKDKCLPLPEIKILNKLNHSTKEIYMFDLSGELDFSRQLLQWRCRKLDLNYKYITRKKEGNNPYTYKISDKGKDYIKENLKIDL